MFLVALVFAAAVPPAHEPRCIVAGHVPDQTTCLIAGYIQTIGELAQAEADAVRLGDSTSVETRAFYAMKARLLAERSAMSRFQPYVAAHDRQVAMGARDVMRGLSILAQWDSTGQEDFRRIVRFEMPAAELTEKVADIKLHANQTQKLLFAMAGAVLDANINQEKGVKRYTKRRMTTVERDSLVARLEQYFPERLKPDTKGEWDSGWAAAAGSIRKSLLDDGWQYLPPESSP
ncbi:MAG: hypothetical protein HOQ17_15785 [Gemmatimonadaceae bacterium]|nr:hypothetical protein [Gemmatimonadaceae bacterium]NUP55390.1 hypothetical protein [Gemmatimonadaceae bacterium]NUR34055.1 hypothetical protein [Gemmatimonadaceae bacterium]NUS34506.1 hypothetical protein [Gemmatimonadaceae bacterium]